MILQNNIYEKFLLIDQDFEAFREDLSKELAKSMIDVSHEIK